MNAEPKRCAIYTRKSSEEGLDQEYNSLDAQRDSGEAYVRSQASEGWKLLPARYDDGGFSGGTMERPGLRALLADIEAKRVDVVVVYKIDRLTRSLADFARIVELFDRHGVTFVSVTQSFNTTTSMGRLTLNVLLSFAQFEREVTGERIRDKIAASKAKGMWMGGVLPLGYDLPVDKSRTLIVNEAEAQTVRRIFATYLELGSVHALERTLTEQGVRSKARVTRDGRELGGCAFSRGALFHLLRNRTYLGQIVHRDKYYPGNHSAIVEFDLFDRVQARLDAGKVERRQSTGRAPLVGRIFDGDGRSMCPTFSKGARGKRYRYYVSAPLQQGSTSRDPGMRRVPAERIEMLLSDLVARASAHPPTEPLEAIRRVDVRATDLELLVDIADFPAASDRLKGTATVERERDRWRICLAATFGRSGPPNIVATVPGPRHDPVLIKALRASHTMIESDARNLPLLDASPPSAHLRRLVRTAFLAPDLQRAVLEGMQPQSLTLERLMRSDLPLDWDEQRRLFARS